jgi:ribosomal protein L32
MTTERRLNCDAIDCTPITIDWSETMGEDMEGWRAFEAFTCDECGRTVVASSLGECECKDLLPTIYIANESGDGSDGEVDNECDATINAEGPMMNYWYPVKLDDCEEAALKIAHLPLCVVEFEDGTTGLALTGGGMNLSWEICEAFVALGYWPPLHFCDLPKMAGRGKSEKDQLLIADCMESCSIAEGWAARKRERLQELKAEGLPVVVCEECGKANRHHHSCSKYDASKRNEVLS